MIVCSLFSDDPDFYCGNAWGIGVFHHSRRQHCRADKYGIHQIYAVHLTGSSGHGVAIVVCNSFIASGLVEGSAGTDFGGLVIYLLSLCFVAAFTAGTVKGAQSLTSRAFGL